MAAAHLADLADARSVDKHPVLPAELLDLIIEFVLRPQSCEGADICTAGAFGAIAPFTLASLQFRSLALRPKTGFLRHVIFSPSEFGENSQWARFFKLLDSLDGRTGGECFTWVRSLRASSKTLYDRFHSARLAALTHLEELSVDLATEGLNTQKPFLKLIDKASHKLTMLTLTSLPCIDIPLLRLIAGTFPYLIDLYLSCTERLEFHCWSCYEESLSRTIHSPIPDMFFDCRAMAIVFARILRPLTFLTHLYLGIYLSDEMLIQYHIDHAEAEEQYPFGPEFCTLCDEAVAEIRLRELAASLEFARSLKALRTIGFSSFDSPGDYTRLSGKRDGDARRNETTVYVRREKGRLRVRKIPWRSSHEEQA